MFEFYILILIVHFEYINAASPCTNTITLVEIVAVNPQTNVPDALQALPDPLRGRSVLIDFTNTSIKHTAKIKHDQQHTEDVEHESRLEYDLNNEEEKQKDGSLQHLEEDYMHIGDNCKGHESTQLQDFCIWRGHSYIVENGVLTIMPFYRSHQATSKIEEVITSIKIMECNTYILDRSDIFVQMYRNDKCRRTQYHNELEDILSYIMDDFYHTNCDVIIDMNLLLLSNIENTTTQLRILGNFIIYYKPNHFKYAAFQIIRNYREHIDGLIIDISLYSQYENETSKYDIEKVYEYLIYNRLKHLKYIKLEGNLEDIKCYLAFLSSGCSETSCRKKMLENCINFGILDLKDCNIIYFNRNSIKYIILRNITRNKERDGCYTLKFILNSSYEFNFTENLDLTFVTSSCSDDESELIDYLTDNSAFAMKLRNKVQELKVLNINCSSKTANDIWSYMNNLICLNLYFDNKDYNQELLWEQGDMLCNRYQINNHLVSVEGTAKYQSFKFDRNRISTFHPYKFLLKHLKGTRIEYCNIMFKVICKTDNVTNFNKIWINVREELARLSYDASNTVFSIYITDMVIGLNCKGNKISKKNRKNKQFSVNKFFLRNTVLGAIKYEHSILIISHNTVGSKLVLESVIIDRNLLITIGYLRNLEKITFTRCHNISLMSNYTTIINGKSGLKNIFGKLISTEVVFNNCTN